MQHPAENARRISQIHAQKHDTGGAQNGPQRFAPRSILAASPSISWTTAGFCATWMASRPVGRAGRGRQGEPRNRRDRPLSRSADRGPIKHRGVSRAGARLRRGVRRHEQVLPERVRRGAREPRGAVSVRRCAGLYGCFGSLRGASSIWCRLGRVATAIGSRAAMRCGSRRRVRAACYSRMTRAHCLLP